jgi:Subtilase family
VTRALAASVAVVVMSAGAPLVAQAGAATAAPVQVSRPSGIHTHHGANGESDVTVCSDAVPVGYMHCLARRRTDRPAVGVQPGLSTPASSPTVIGNGGAYDPAYLRSAYGVPANAGAGQTIAVVDAFDDPNAEADMAVYRERWGLPACTTASGCFRKVDQNGGDTQPGTNASWIEEISLDLDMVSAICPKCNILLVEASSARGTDLGTAVNTAASLGAVAISNSFGADEYPSEMLDAARYFDHPGIAVVASSGDGGYGATFPAADSTVIAVGGTTLHQKDHNGTRRGSEQVWAGAGSGCSAYVPKPAWQTDTGCATRTVADVAAVADPETGVWVYDSFGGDTGFEIFGGTSAATPIIAAMYALAANPASTNYPSQFPYLHRPDLHDITKGANGTCSPTYLCTGAKGYDGPTGLGSPKGIAAFAVPPTMVAAVPDAAGLVAARSTTRGIDLTWDAPSANGSAITSYQLYRSGVSGNEKTLVNLVCTTTSCAYTDVTVRHGKVAYYQIVAINSIGAGPRSGEVSAKSK